MPLLRLGAEGIRNLQSFNLEFSPRLNIITGLNGAGKTSLLEAIYVLANGRSFRTAKLNKVVSDSRRDFRIVARVGSEVSSHGLDFRRDKSDIHIRLDGDLVKGISRFATLLPVISISADSHKLIEEGPELRRRFLDWSVFHVEQTDVSVWKNYDSALRQRNSALRQGLADASVRVWDEPLVRYGLAVTEARDRVTSLISSECGVLFNRLGGEGDIRLEYGVHSPRNSVDYLAGLSDRIDLDRQRGYTSLGPHREDMRIRLNGSESRERLSRGQQKLLSNALLLSQANTYSSVTSATPSILMDDLPSELDEQHRYSLFQVIADSGHQAFITAIDSGDLPQSTSSSTRFHVKHGSINSVL